MIPGVSYKDIMAGEIHFSYLECGDSTFVNGIVQIEVTLYKILQDVLCCKSQNGEEDKVRKC